MNTSSDARSTTTVSPAHDEDDAARLDRRVFYLAPEDFDAFAAALDAPPAPNPRLAALLATPAPWED